MANEDVYIDLPQARAQLSLSLCAYAPRHQMKRILANVIGRLERQHSRRTTVDILRNRNNVAT